MTNIWSFLLQTLMASVVAVILLAVKKLLEDKLSQRWQYGVWSVLVLRILVPVNLSMRNLLSMPLSWEAHKWLVTCFGIIGIVVGIWICVELNAFRKALEEDSLGVTITEPLE